MSADQPVLQQDQGPELLVISTIFAILATISVVGRFLARKIRKLSWAADDYTVLVALVIPPQPRFICYTG